MAQVTEPQARMAETGNEMILASAGTGKTYALSSRYLRLLVDGVSPRSILATTFTRKAAGEILDRIVQRLASAAIDNAVAKQTAIDIQRPGTTREMFAELIVQLTRDLNNLQVETLDAFFAKVARAFSLDLGLPHDWEIVEEGEMTVLQNLAIRRALTRRATLEIVRGLSRGEATRGIGSMVRGVVGNLYGIYRETVDGDRIAAWEALREFPLLADDELDELCRQLNELPLPDRKSIQGALAGDLVELNRRDWGALLRKGLAKALSQNQFTYSRVEIPAEIAGPMKRIAAHGIGLQINVLVVQTRAAKQFLEGFHSEFNELKFGGATLRFDDVCYLAGRLLAKYSAGQLAYRMDRHIDHLMLDEFQDTSIDQWQVLKPLATRTCTPAPNRSFFCVGDVKQAIYGWRGGVAEVFDDARAEFGERLGEPASLVKSWRSSPVVIDTINRVFDNLLEHRNIQDKKFAYESWLQRFEKHETEHAELAGYAALEVTSAESTHEAQVAARIRDLARQYPDKSIGVLTRKNAQIARLIFELGNLDVRASEEGGNPLTDSAAVNVVLSGLRLIDQPDDMLSRFHVLHSPLASQFDLTAENWRTPDAPCRRAASRARQALLNRGYGELIAEWARVLSPQCTAREWFRLCQLVEKGFWVSTADHPRTRDFVTWIVTARVPDPSSSQIRVMTIHKSKGLEFDVVVLPFMDFNTSQTPFYIVGRDTPTSPIQLVCRYMDVVKREWLPKEFQDAFKRTTESSVHEKLAMMYVALTRARQAIHMIVPAGTHSGLTSAAGLIMAALDIRKRTEDDGTVATVWSHEDSSQNLDSNDPASVSRRFAVKPPRTSTRSTRTGEVPAEIGFAMRDDGGRNQPWESPSSRESSDRVHVGRLLQLEDNRDARTAGLLMHACLEQVEWLEDFQFDPKALRTRLATVEGADARGIEKAISDFRIALKQPGLRAVLGRDQYRADLFNSWDGILASTERRFAVRIDGRIVAGSIDRLVLLKRDGKIAGADVIDFKSDAIPPRDRGAIRKRTEVYRPQIIAYRDSVATMLGLPRERVTARIMFVAIDCAVQID